MATGNSCSWLLGGRRVCIGNAYRRARIRGFSARRSAPHFRSAGDWSRRPIVEDTRRKHSWRPLNGVMIIWSRKPPRALFKWTTHHLFESQRNLATGRFFGRPRSTIRERYSLEPTPKSRTYVSRLAAHCPASFEFRIASRPEAHHRRPQERFR